LNIAPHLAGMKENNAKILLVTKFKQIEGINKQTNKSNEKPNNSFTHKEKINE
jgi:hypothetical protein